MTQMYAAAYLVRRGHHPPASGDEVISAFFEALDADRFPYDAGDDPAFFSARYFNGPVTWGVCRTDVRRNIQPGDWMVFFSREEDRQDTDILRYRFVAGLKVESKIAQTEIFSDPAHKPFRKYVNLLVRPNGSGWEWYEPSLHHTHTRGHRDWLWRLCQPAKLRKAVVRELGLAHKAGHPLPLEAAHNYVVFSKHDSLIASEPPLVAVYRRGQRQEIWESDSRSNAIRKVVFGDSDRRLRTTNPQQPHRHFRRQIDPSVWPELLRSAVAQQCDRL